MLTRSLLPKELGQLFIQVINGFLLLGAMSRMLSRIQFKQQPTPGIFQKFPLPGLCRARQMIATWHGRCLAFFHLHFNRFTFPAACQYVESSNQPWQVLSSTATGGPSSNSSASGKKVHNAWNST